MLHELRQQLITVMNLATAGKTDALSDKLQALLAESRLLLTGLLVRYRPVPALKGKGQFMLIYSADGTRKFNS